MAGGELVRASAICALSVNIERLPSGVEGEEQQNESQFLMYEVSVDDRAEWAVCGRAVGVLNMITKQTSVVVEVMALTGGHLLLPKVNVTKYFPVTSQNGPTDTDSSSTAKATSHHVKGRAFFYSSKKSPPRQRQPKLFCCFL